MRIITSFLIITILLSSIAATAAPAAQATSGTLTITKNTVLTRDHYGSIIIAADGITLNGNGHSIIGNGSGDGIYFRDQTEVTIKNLKIKNFSRGITIYGDSSYNNIKGNTISHNKQDGIRIGGVYTRKNTISGNTISNNGGSGIYLEVSRENIITGNTILKNGGTGIYLDTVCDRTTITGNTISKNSRGIYVRVSRSNTLTDNIISNNEHEGVSLIVSSDNNTLTGNTISNNNIGITIFSSSGNNIYRNNFISNPTQADVQGGSGNLFNLPTPIGGNYWSNYNTASEDCVDNNNDGFCDSPYVFTGGQDNLPWTRMNSWVPTIKGLIDQVKGLHIPAGSENELLSILNNAKKSFDKGKDDAASNQMQSFINKVEAQSGKKIPEGDADTLIANAEAIIAQLKH